MTMEEALPTWDRRNYQIHTHTLERSRTVYSEETVNSLRPENAWYSLKLKETVSVEHSWLHIRMVPERETKKLTMREGRAEVLSRKECLTEGKK